MIRYFSKLRTSRGQFQDEEADPFTKALLESDLPLQHDQAYVDLRFSDALMLALLFGN